MTYAVFQPYLVFADADGSPLENGYIYIGQSNQNPEVYPLTAYWDEALSITAAQPIRTMAGFPKRNGTPSNIYTATDYSITIRDKNGALVFSAPTSNYLVDPLRTELAASSGSSLVGFIQAGVGAVVRTVQAKLRDIISSIDYPSSSDFSTALAALTANIGVASLSTPNINSGPLYGSRAINGPCEISQVNGTTAVTPTANGYVIDQFFYASTQASKLTFQQVSDAPAGLKNSLKVSVAAQFSPGAADQFWISQPIEGINVIDFQLGTAGAVTFTTSEWIKGSVAGTYAVSIGNAAQNRSYVGTLTVTTSWAPVKLTLTGDITGTWATDNTAGLWWRLDLGSGSSFNATAGSWQAGNFLRTAGSVTFVNQTNGSTLNITGLDIRLGSVAPTIFERRDVGEELRRCQRYLPAWAFTAANVRGMHGQCISATDCVLTLINPSQARVPATGIVIIGTFQLLTAIAGAVNITAAAIAQSGPLTTTVGFTVATGLVAGNATTLIGPAAGSGLIYGTGAQL